MTSSARRALRVLEIVNSAPEAIGVTAIAEAAGTVPGTAYRSLDALERCDLVSRYRASTQYQVGAAARRLKQTVYAQFALRNLAIPFLRRLAFATSDTICLTVPAGWIGLRLAVVAGTRPVRSAAALGLAGPLDEDFAGRAILSTYDPAAIARYIAEAPTSGDTVRSAAPLIQALRDIASQGYSVDVSEQGSRHGSAAIPILYRGRAIAAVGIEGPVVDLDSGALPPDWATWRLIVGEIETEITRIEPFCENPFGHIDPAIVTRALCAPIAPDDGAADDSED